MPAYPACVSAEPAPHRPDLSAGPSGAEETPVHLAPAVELVPAPVSLRRNRDFLVVLFGQGVSSFGDAITNTALPILVLALTGSGFAMGIVGVLSTLPDLVVGLPAGAYADRWDRRRMMLGADLGRAVLTALVPLSAWIGGPTLAVVIGVAFPLNVLRVLWLAAFTAAVPGLVGRDQVPRANGVLEAVWTVGWVVGPALAGVLAVAIGPGPTIAIDAATFAVSAGTLFLVRRPLRPEARATQTHIVADVREGIAFVGRHPTLRAVIAFWTTTSVISAGLTSGLIFYITVNRDLGTAVVGLVLSAFAVGSLGGAIVAARVAPKLVGLVMLVGAVGMGIALVLSVGSTIPVIMVMCLLAGILNSYVLVAYLSLRTMLSPDALLGRVGATARTVSVGLMPVGSLLTGIALDAIGGGATLTLMGLGLVAAGVGFALVPNVRRARLAG